MQRLSQLLVLSWRQKAAARSAPRLTIEDTLDTGLPRAYSKQIYLQKSAALFEHLFESYPEHNRSIYADVA